MRYDLETDKLISSNELANWTCDWSKMPKRNNRKIEKYHRWTVETITKNGVTFLSIITLRAKH